MGTQQGRLARRQETAATALHWEQAGRLPCSPATGEAHAAEPTVLTIKTSGAIIVGQKGAWAPSAGMLGWDGFI